MANIDTQNLKDPEVLTKEQIEEILPLFPELKKWIKKVEDYALDNALKGEEFKGFKLVEGRSQSHFTNTTKLLEQLEADGYDRAIFLKPQEMIGVTDAKRILKKDFEKYQDYVEKNPAKITLVEESDKRPAVQIKTKTAEEVYDDLV